MMRRAMILAGLLIVFAVCGWNIAENEAILERGQVVRLALAPIDPRSLLQGDYMALNYQINGQIPTTRSHADGYVVVAPDATGVARYVRTQAEPMPLAAGEAVLRYRVREGGWGRRGGMVRLATNAFFFQEGEGKRFDAAKYGEFRVGANGEPRLVALLDGNLRRLGENRH